MSRLGDATIEAGNVLEGKRERQFRSAQPLLKPG